MKRRNALKAVSIIFGGTIISSELFLSSCKSDSTVMIQNAFSEEQLSMLGQIAETILPETSTPGAIEAGVDKFIPMMLEDCYSEEQNKIVRVGLDLIDHESRNKYKKAFLKIKQSEKDEIISKIDKDAFASDDDQHFFRILKEITLLGYFTSEPGLTIAQNYVKIPGKYDGEASYTEGDKNTIFALGR